MLPYLVWVRDFGGEKVSLRNWAKFWEIQIRLGTLAENE